MDEGPNLGTEMLPGIQGMASSPALCSGQGQRTGGLLTPAALHDSPYPVLGQSYLDAQHYDRGPRDRAGLCRSPRAAAHTWGQSPTRGTTSTPREMPLNRYHRGWRCSQGVLIPGSPSHPGTRGPRAGTRGSGSTGEEVPGSPPEGPQTFPVRCRGSGKTCSLCSSP